MARIIEVVEHDQNWVAAFQKEADALAFIFGEQLRQIHHIGSTSVPGLPAKPIIDILVVLNETVTTNNLTLRWRRLGIDRVASAWTPPFQAHQEGFTLAKITMAFAHTRHTYAQKDTLR